MLRRRYDFSTLLDTSDVFNSQSAAKERVFGKALEVAAAEWISVTAYCWRSKNVSGLRFCLLAKKLADCLDIWSAPCGCLHDRSR